MQALGIQPLEFREKAPAEFSAKRALFNPLFKAKGGESASRRIQGTALTIFRRCLDPVSRFIDGGSMDLVDHASSGPRR